jgi:hypothetical protein
VESVKLRDYIDDANVSPYGETMTARRLVAYYRVSTAKQGASGLGLEAQQEAVRTDLNGGSSQLIAEVVEVESGNAPTVPSSQKPSGSAGFTTPP